MSRSSRKFQPLRRSSYFCRTDIASAPCRPNPFNSRLVVPFSLGRDGRVSIKVFSFDGRLVRKFAGKFPAGEHRWVWDGKDEEGQVVASGVYTVRMEARDFRASEKVALVR